MSGYALLAGDDAKVLRAAQLFAAQETTTIPLAPGVSLLYVTNSGSALEGVLFQGYAIDHEREAMIFDGAAPDELPDPSQPVEGSYFTARFDAQTLRAGADSYGFVPMVWFSDPGIAAISDSYHTLISIRRSLNLPRTPDLETIRGRMWLNSMSLQQMGQETFCQEIRYATPGAQLTLSIPDGTLREAPLNLQDFYSESFADHAEAVMMSVTRMVRTFKTYAASGSLTTLGLSGGTDSRVCLAAALAADVGGALHVASANKKTRLNDNQDYAVAVALSEQFGFPLNKPNSQVQGMLSSNDLLAGWAATGMGVYDALYMPAQFRHRPVPVFAVGGQGAEISKGNFGWRPLSAINMPREALDQAGRTLERIGIPADHKWGSEWHYIAFRNALHGGRATLSSDYVARPAAQIPLIGLSRSPLNDMPAPRKAAPSVVLDSLIALSPEMALAPFDDPRKNVLPEYVDQRLQRLGGPLDSKGLAPYSVHGTPQPAKGTLASQIDLARAAGFEGDLDAATLVPLTREPMAHFKEVLADSLVEKVEELNVKSRARIGAASREAGALGKIIALTTVI